MRETLGDLTRAVSESEADLLVSSELVYAAPLIAERFGLLWASYVTTPMSFFSAYDPPVLSPYRRLSTFVRSLNSYSCVGRRLCELVAKS